MFLTAIWLSSSTSARNSSRAVRSSRRSWMYWTACSRPMAMSRPRTMVAMWMKNSRQVLAAWVEGWMSIMGWDSSGAEGPDAGGSDDGSGGGAAGGGTTG